MGKMIMDFGDSEYEIDMRCPNCGSKDIITEFFLGLYYFSSCRKCGFRKDKTEAVRH